MQVYHLDLQELPLFRDLLPEEIERFITATGATVERVGKGKRILEAYEENHNIGVLVEGEAQVLAEDRFGNESVSHHLERGAMMGSTSAIMPQIPNDTAVQAITTVLVLWIPYKALLTAGTKLGRTHGIVMKNILESFCKKNVLMMQKIKILSQKTLRERLILYLLYRQQRQGKQQVQVPGRVQLAKELECNRSALTREIGSMQREGVLRAAEDWMELDAEKIAAMG